MQTQSGTDALMTGTIKDFGEQWLAFTRNDGYYGSVDLLADIVAPLLPLDEIEHRRVADVGSGTGRIVKMLLAAGASHVTAVEPSQCFPVLRANLAGEEGRVLCLNVPGNELPATGDLDYVFSIGVIHHIPDPAPTLRAMLQALKPGGKAMVWVYGHEGNRSYLAVARPLRAVTRRLPHPVLAGLSWSMVPPLLAYIGACRLLPLPMRQYMLGHLGRLSLRNMMLTVYDQLNPAYAKYYRRDELAAILKETGFTDIRLHHRHGYSWTAMATRPL